MKPKPNYRLSILDLVVLIATLGSLKVMDWCRDYIIRRAQAEYTPQEFEKWSADNAELWE